jgi:hypothetical protein
MKELARSSAAQPLNNNTYYEGDEVVSPTPTLINSIHRMVILGMKINFLVVFVIPLGVSGWVLVKHKKQNGLDLTAL